MPLTLQIECDFLCCLHKCDVVLQYGLLSLDHFNNQPSIKKKQHQQIPDINQWYLEGFGNSS